MPVIALNYNPNVSSNLISLFIEEDFNFNELMTIEFYQSNKDVFTEIQPVICRKIVGTTINDIVISIVVTILENKSVLCHVLKDDKVFRTFILTNELSFFRVVVFIYTFTYQEMFL